MAQSSCCSSIIVLNNCSVFYLLVCCFYSCTSSQLNLVNVKKMVEHKTAQLVSSQKSKAVRKQDAAQPAIKHRETEPMNYMNV